MAKDYARRNTRHTTKGRKKTVSAAQTKSSGGLWLLTGLLAGILIASLVYLKQQPKAATQELNNQQNTQQPTPTKTNLPIATKTTANPAANSDQPKFDFYTVLPKMNTMAPPDQTVTSTTPPANPSNTTTANTTAPNNNPAVPPPFSLPNTAANPVTPANNPASAQVNNQNPQPNPAPQVAASPTPVAPAANNNSAVRTQAATPQPNPVTKVTPSVANNNPTPSANTNQHYILEVARFESYQQADALKAQLTLSGFNVSIETISLPNKTLNRVVVGPFNDLASAKAAENNLAGQQISSTLISLNN